MRLRLQSDGQLANPLPRRRIDRVSQRRHDTRSARFTDATRCLHALYQFHFNGRRLADAEYPVVTEVGLLDAAVLDRDLPVQSGRQAEYDAAFHLGADRVWI